MKKLLIVISLLAILDTPTKALSAEAQKCKEVVTQAFKGIGIDISDSVNKEQFGKLKAHYINKPMWNNIREACSLNNSVCDTCTDNDCSGWSGFRCFWYCFGGCSN